VLWFFLPETSIAKDARFQQLLASRFFSDAGQQALYTVRSLPWSAARRRWCG